MSTSDPARPIAATYDANDNPIWRSVTTAPDASVGQCKMVPDRMIPVIFLPGIMGSNLRGIGEAIGYQWRLDGARSLAPWLFRGPETRKLVLRPETTEVDPNGVLPDDTPHSSDELLRRGWGEIGAMSYSDALVWFENSLNDFDQGAPRNGERMRLTRIGLDAEVGESRLTEDEVAFSYRYRFPIYACGYNWLASNAASARDHLDRRIQQIKDRYRQEGKRCDKVILVTHSMGGLVARHYTEAQNKRDNVFGTIHGVMPAIGAAAVYRRFKSGTEGTYPTTAVMGRSGAEMTAVLSSAPGALQLLPAPQYGNGWLRIQDDVNNETLPRNGDPYGEIYLSRGRWWSMCEDHLINPETRRMTHANRKPHIDSDWRRYLELIDEDVRAFHTEIQDQYHPTTYSFIGDDETNLAYGNVTWQGTVVNIPGSSRDSVVGHPVDILNKPATAILTSEERLVSVKLPDSASFPLKHLRFVISAPDERGDGTVPRRSGIAAQRASRAFLRVNVGHEPAFKYTSGADNLRACRFTLRCIVKIAQSAKISAKLKYE